MQCHIASELLSVQLDSHLAEEEQEALQRHLAGCAQCRQELAWMERADALFQGVTLATPSPQLAEAIMARVQRRAASTAMLRGGMIVLLAAIVLLGVVLVPLAAFYGPLAVSASPATVSALVGVIVRMAGILLTLLQAGYLVLRAIVASPGIAALVVYAVGAAALALWWVRIVAGPGTSTLRRRTG